MLEMHKVQKVSQSRENLWNLMKQHFLGIE